MTTITAAQLVCPHCDTINRIPKQKLHDQPLCGKCKKHLVTGQPINATDSNFSRYLNKTSLPVVVDFWAPWCGPCVQFAPIYSQVAGEMATHASFVELDTQANQQTAMQYNIRSIPTLMIFYEGKEVARMAGALPKAQFVQWLHQQMGQIMR